mgnify:FL=1
MSQLNEVSQPIICDAYQEPTRHWVIERGRPAVTVEGRREACYYYRPPGRSTGAEQADEIGTRFTLDLVNEIRKRVAAWRGAGFPGVTGVTGELLAYWNRADRERRP